MDSGASGIVELGRFMTGFLVVMGIGTSALCSRSFVGDGEENGRNEESCSETEETGWVVQWGMVILGTEPQANILQHSRSFSRTAH